MSAYRARSEKETDTMDIQSVTAADIAVTGDRPTGRLHLGHFAGSLVTRLALQGRCRQVVLIADLQALTDHAAAGAHVAENVLEVALDYLAVGIDPARSMICLQSELPELLELAALYANIVSVSRLERNPTIREEQRLRGFARDIPLGFLAYPVSQAADITGFGGTVVPVGADQLPMIELANEVVRAVRFLAGRPVLGEARALVGRTARLPGTDGRAKMSKSLGNAIALATPADALRAAVRGMYTDPRHVRVEDPGTVEGNVVFAYLEAFDPDAEGLDAVKAAYRRGGVPDTAVKARLERVLEELLGPIRERRAALARRPDDVMDVIRDGTSRARAAPVVAEVRDIFGLGRIRRAEVQNA
jgi:tryptophanyl-tRNA synthetase